MTSHAYSERKSRQMGPSRAFTLIEVVLAIGIVAFSLLAIVGTIPIGLHTMSSAQTDQAEGTIANQLRGDLQQISFGTGAGSLSTLAGTNYYYTTEGLKTDTAGTAGTPYYQAQFFISNAAVNGSAFSQSGSTPLNSAAITVVLTYPYPSTAQTNSFSLLATKQIGD